MPRIVGWQFKLETNRVLCVTVKRAELFVNEGQFYAKMRSDGRTTIPKLVRNMLQESMPEKQSLLGAILEFKRQRKRRYERLRGFCHSLEQVLGL